MLKMNNGWIKLHRKLTEWEWYSDPNVFRLFIHLLLKANHKPKNYKGIEIESGTIITGLSLLSEQTGLSLQQIRTAIKRLKSTNEIIVKPSNKGTVIQIVKYVDYQLQSDELTNEQQTNNKPITTNKNVKKEKNIMFESFWSVYPKKVAKTKCENKFNNLHIKDKECILATINDFIKYKPFETYTHPNAMTYLNQERWKDEIPKAQNKKFSLGI